MSERIYVLSKKIGMENNELLALLKERGFQVKSASSTIDNISAESLIEEFAKPAADPVQEPEPEEVKIPEPSKTSPLPPGAFVKSKEEIEKERNAGSQPPPVLVAVPEPPVALQTEPSSTGPGAAKAPSLPPPVIPLGSPTAPGETPDLVAEKAQQEDKKELEVIQVKPPIVVRDFAIQLQLKPFRLISELMEMDIFASMNQVIEEDIATRIAENHGFLLEVRHRGERPPETLEPAKKKPEIDESKLEPRPPVVCILGHVDHGKTTLLDTIRKTNVVEGEFGGITQHIGACQIEHNGHNITFIDTPGHAAFSKMRARGANVTDIVVLLVAADDGFMPQTDEALGFARLAKVPIIVAINKIDAPGADIDRVKRQMQERELAPEDWGGETISVAVSALKNENIDSLLEMILLQAEIMELKANSNGRSEGVIIDSQKEIGHGSTASVIVQQGILKVGDSLICNGNYCKVKVLLDDKGNDIKKAKPSTPVKVIGWSGPPDSGAVFQTLKNEREAKRQAEENAFELKKLPQLAPEQTDEKATSLDKLMEAIAQTRQKVFRVVVKSDVLGTAEAIVENLQQIKSEKIGIDIVQNSIGLVSKNDILLAVAAEAVIVAFNTNIESGVAVFTKQHNITIYQHHVIYELIDQIKEAMVDQLDPELVESKIGVAEVRQVFSVAKGAVAGCLVTEGRIVRDAKARLLRGDKVLHESKLETLKRFKDDVGDVRAGYECGLRLDGFNKYEEGDLIECFEFKKIQPKL